MVTFGVIGQPVLGSAVAVSSMYPFVISSSVGVKLGVSELGFTITLLFPTGVVFVQRIELASVVVIKSGKVNVSAHNVISLSEAKIVGFLFIKIVISSVTATCGQAAFGIADIVNVTEEVSADPNVYVGFTKLLVKSKLPLAPVDLVQVTEL